MSSTPNVESTVADTVVPLAHLRAAETGAVVAHLPSRVVLAQGPDAASFLHGQLANDVTGLPVGGVNRSLSLNHRGHAMAESSVLRRGKDEFLLVVGDDGGEFVIDSLEQHIIFDQVTLTPQPDLVLLTLQGAGAAQLLPQAPQAGSSSVCELAGHQVTAFPRRRSTGGGFDLLVDRAGAEAVTATLVDAGGVEVAPAVIDALRIRALLPTAGREGGEGVLPQEAGLEDALSYRKGCYLGQEIMARIEARGNLRRSLTRLELDSAAVTGRQISRGGRAVGLLGSVVQIEGPDGGAPMVEALAVLRNDLEGDEPLEVAGANVCRVHERA